MRLLVTMPGNPPNEESSDPRVAGLATVGWITLAASGISIPLTAIAEKTSVNVFPSNKIPSP